VESEGGNMERAQLGIDGNCGFALLGVDLQEGAAEFEEIKGSFPVGSGDWIRAADAASKRAFQKLRDRLPDKTFSYYIGPSHPKYC
jgi:hypothetical protein